MNLWVMLLGWVAPQTILLSLNWQAWLLASGDMGPTERYHAYLILGTELLALLAGVAVAVDLGWRRKTLTRWMGCLPLGVVMLFLAMVFTQAERAIPAALADWMLPRDQWIFKQFALAMPAALLGAFRLLCPDREDENQEVPGFARALFMAVILLGLSIGYLFFWGTILSHLRVDFPENAFVMVAFIGGFLVVSTLAAASLLRVAVSLYVWTRARSFVALAGLTFLIAIFGPICGLALNITIPFPFDFQMRAIYVVAVVNGVVLMLPNFTNPALHRLVWLAQCALFPFTVYFFLVFVPFLPLGPLALIVLGAGFLMYVPSLLFILHGYRILDGFRIEALRGSKWTAGLIGAAVVVAWPVGYTFQARWDRGALHGALDYLQYPDYSVNGHYTGSPSELRSALFHLRDFKQGFYLPLISDYYNWLVFDNLVLPQSRLESLYQSFFGEALPASAARANPNFFGRGWEGGRGRSVTEVMSGQQGTRPSANAVLQDVRSTTVTDGNAQRTTAKVTVTNPGGAATEFRTTIAVPPGVEVSNFWLTIGKERVPGQIFEKRAAMWVYQKITEIQPVPRDPAILRYTGPNQLELNVYPVESGAPRVVEVEFLYPQGTSPDIRIGQARVETPPVEEPVANVAVAPDGNFAVVIPEAATKGLPTVTREPYLHVIVDASRNSSLRDLGIRERALERLTTSFPKVSRMRVTYANYESRDFRAGAILPTADLAKYGIEGLRTKEAIFRGGFLPDRAVKEILWQYHLQLAKPDSIALKSYPQIVVLATSGYSLPEDRGNLAEFARLLPECPGFWLMHEGATTAQYVPLTPHEAAREPVLVGIFQVGGQRFAAGLPGGVTYTSLHPAAGSLKGIEVFDQASGKFVPVGKPAAEGSDALKLAVTPWSIELERIFEPFREKGKELGALLRVCRATGILVPSAAYMVVENQTQWKILEQTEKKALKGHEALALSETTPEPMTIALLILAAVFFAWRFFLGRFLGTNILRKIQEFAR